MRSFLMAALTTVAGLPAHAGKLTANDFFGAGVLLKEDFPNAESVTVEALAATGIIIELGASDSCPAELVETSNKKAAFVKTRVRLIEFGWDRDWSPGETLYRVYTRADELQLIVKIPWNEQSLLSQEDCTLHVIAVNK